MVEFKPNQSQTSFHLLQPCSTLRRLPVPVLLHHFHSANPFFSISSILLQLLAKRLGNLVWFEKLIAKHECQTRVHVCLFVLQVLWFWKPEQKRAKTKRKHGKVLCKTMLMMAKKKSGADLTDHRRFIMQQTSCVLASSNVLQPTNSTHNLVHTINWNQNWKATRKQIMNKLFLLVGNSPPFSHHQMRIVHRVCLSIKRKFEQTWEHLGRRLAGGGGGCDGDTYPWMILINQTKGSSTFKFDEHSSCMWRPCMHGNNLVQGKKKKNIQVENKKMNHDFD